MEDNRGPIDNVGKKPKCNVAKTVKTASEVRESEREGKKIGR